MTGAAARTSCWQRHASMARVKKNKKTPKTGYKDSNSERSQNKKEKALRHVLFILVRMTARLFLKLQL